MRKTLIIAVVLSLTAGSAFAQATGEATTERTREVFEDGSPYQAGRPMLAARPAGDKAVVRTVVDAMGFVRGYGAQESTDVLNRLMWRGTGTVIGSKGAMTELTRYTYTVGMLSNSAREDIEAPTGRRVTVVSGDKAWDESEPGVGAKAVAPALAKERRLRFARTPFGFTRALLKADLATIKVVDPGPGGAPITVTVPVEGVPTTATLDKYYRPASIRMTVGGVRYEATYADYKDLSEYGVMFPTKIVEKTNDKTTADLTIDDGRVASYAIFTPPAR